MEGLGSGGGVAKLALKSASKLALDLALRLRVRPNQVICGLGFGYVQGERSLLGVYGQTGVERFHGVRSFLGFKMWFLGQLWLLLSQVWL